MNEIRYTVADPTGNITLLVENETEIDKIKDVADNLMKQEPLAEQVGFVSFYDGKKADLIMRMAGGEFCGNATMSAGAMYAGRNGINSGIVRVNFEGIDEILNVKVAKTEESRKSGIIKNECIKSNIIDVNGENSCIEKANSVLGSLESVYDCELELKGAKRIYDAWDTLGVHGTIVELDGITHLIVACGTEDTKKRQACGTEAEKTGLECKTETTKSDFECKIEGAKKELEHEIETPKTGLECKTEEGRRNAEIKIKEFCRILGAQSMGIMFVEMNAFERQKVVGMDDEECPKCAKRNDVVMSGHAEAAGNCAENKITALVYVPAADTLYWENSCASGTVAVGAWLAEEVFKNNERHEREKKDRKAPECEKEDNNWDNEKQEQDNRDSGKQEQDNRDSEKQEQDNRDSGKQEQDNSDSEKQEPDNRGSEKQEQDREDNEKKDIVCEAFRHPGGVLKVRVTADGKIIIGGCVRIYKSKIL